MVYRGGEKLNQRERPKTNRAGNKMRKLTRVEILKLENSLSISIRGTGNSLPLVHLLTGLIIVNDFDGSRCRTANSGTRTGGTQELQRELD